MELRAMRNARIGLLVVPVLLATSVVPVRPAGWLPGAGA